MKYLACFLLILLLPAAVFAQWGGGVIGVYTSHYSGTCLAFDVPGPMTLYVIQRSVIDASGSRFRIELSPGFTGVLVSVTSPFSGVDGDPLTGVTVTYDGACMINRVEVLELHFMMLGTSAECSWVRTAPHPLSVDGKLDTYNCAHTRLPAEWGGTHVYMDFPFPPFCPDETFPDVLDYACRPIQDPLPTASATWGAVKALYR